jgi:uncharacterized membrane protein YfcA
MMTIIMTFMLLFFIAALAFGIYEASSKKRGPLGWIVSIVASVVGGMFGAYLASMAVESLLETTHMRPEGSLWAMGHPLLYVGGACMVIGLLLGSWIALWIVNRFR